MKNKITNPTRGFTIVELIIVMAVFAVLISLTSINLFNSQHKASMTSSIELISGDISEQQNKAMNGDVSINSTSFTGIYFQKNSYTLFQGNTYSVNDPTNYTINLTDSVYFSNINLPSSVILFSAGSGEVSNYSPSQNSLTLHDINSPEEKTITFNKYGIITNVN